MQSWKVKYDFTALTDMNKAYVHTPCLVIELDKIKLEI